METPLRLILSPMRLRLAVDAGSVIPWLVDSKFVLRVTNELWYICSPPVELIQDILVSMCAFITDSTARLIFLFSAGFVHRNPGEKKNNILPRCGTTFIVITVYKCCSLLHISYHWNARDRPFKFVPKVTAFNCVPGIVRKAFKAAGSSLPKAQLFTNSTRDCSKRIDFASSFPICGFRGVWNFRV